MLNATLQAVFPMEAAMPYMVEEAIINAYKTKGWDIYNNENYLFDDPWQADADVWPTFSDMITELDAVIESKKLGQDFTDKYRGSLVARFTNLTLGTKGRMLNTRRSINFDLLLDKKVVIELEDIKDEQDKALLMGLIVVRMAESMKHRHRHNKDFLHLTLVEEAHRLLSKVEAGDAGSKKMGVSMFANLLAEVRKYGEGLIIADQIPNKLVSDVLKNTNTQIVHRLFAADDREAIGDTMSLNDEQKDFLPLLNVGEAVVYSGGWHAPVRVKVTEVQSTTEAEIDECHIRERGKHQFWQQRAAILPILSQESCWNVDNLSDFLRDGLAILNRFLKLQTMMNDKSDPLKREKLYQQLQQQLRSLSTRLAISQEVLSSHLAKLLQDVSVKSVTGSAVEALSATLTASAVSFDSFTSAFNDHDYVLNHLSIESL
jgi:hypothetical protein